MVVGGGGWWVRNSGGGLTTHADRMTACRGLFAKCLAAQEDSTKVTDALCRWKPPPATSDLPSDAVVAKLVHNYKPEEFRPH